VAMRVAALYDVHGNVRALEAVLADAGDADAFVFGGDVFWGPWPRETLELVQSLGDRAHFVRGNWERYLLEGKDEWTAEHVPAPLTVCGHTHVQFQVDRIVNPGSVGLPTVHAAAWWAVVDDGDVELRATAYDTVAAADAMRRSGMPEADELADQLLEPYTVERLLEIVG